MKVVVHEFMPTMPGITIVPANEASWEDLPGRFRHARRFVEVPVSAVQDAAA